MLAKKFHLPVQGASRLKSSYRSRHFIFREKSNDLSFTRFGVLVSRKVHKLATRRNKIKRAVFNFIRLGKAHLKAGKDVLIIALPQAANLKDEDIQKELNEFLNNKQHG